MNSPEHIAKVFGCSVEQAKAQLARNAQQLEAIADKARQTGRPVNHYTEKELREHAANFRTAANS